MYPESLGQHAVQGNFNFVSVRIVEGRYLPEAKTKKANAIVNGGTFFKNVKEQFFDKTDVDIAVLEEIRKAHRQVKPSSTVEGIIELASQIALNEVSVADKIFGKEEQQGRLDKLLSYSVPTKLEWEADIEGQPYPLPLFIKNAVPFLRTREWLSDRLERMRAAETDRFIAAIQIRRHPAMVVV